MKKETIHLFKSQTTWNPRCGTSNDFKGNDLIENVTCKNCIRLYKSDIVKEHKGFK
jgi:hypothetical protein